MSHLAYSRMALRIVATLAATAWLTACGYKGPLYLPPPTPAAKAAKAAQRPSAARRPAAPAPTPPAVAPGVTITPAYPSYPLLTVPQ